MEKKDPTGENSLNPFNPTSRSSDFQTGTPAGNIENSEEQTLEQAAQAYAINDSPAPQPEPVGATEPSQKPKKTFSQVVFNKETGFGRFMRGLVKTIAAIVILVSVGLILGYFLFYKPLVDEHTLLKSDHQAAMTQVIDLQAELDKKSAGFIDLESDASIAQEQLETNETRVKFLQLKNSVMQARYLTLAKDGPGAREAVQTAQVLITDLQPGFEKLKAEADVLDVVDKRLALVLSELTSDPKTAQKDLETAYTRLLEIEEIVFK